MRLKFLLQHPDGASSWLHVARDEEPPQPTCSLTFVLTLAAAFVQHGAGADRLLLTGRERLLQLHFSAAPAIESGAR